MKMAMFWVVAPCILAGLVDGDSKHFLNVGKLLADYTAQHPRRQPSSQ
jgi:hypothetical protein